MPLIISAFTNTTDFSFPLSDTENEEINIGELMHSKYRERVKSQKTFQTNFWTRLENIE